MYSINSHTGDVIDIPSTISEDDAYFGAMTADALNYYHINGYVVLRSLLPKEITSSARESFSTDIKPSKKYIYRQSTSRPEKNIFDNLGYVSNPILNVQSLSRTTFTKFRETAIACITHPNLMAALSTLYGEPAKIVQSMYFEGNTTTAPHQDTFYLDSEHLGTMCAAWLALEDIAPNAGRFFVCPGSHNIDIRDHGVDFNVSGDPRRYEALILELQRKLKLKVVAPALQEGDVLIWNSRTIHGALESPNATSSRQSLTAHFIPISNGFMQLQSRIKPLVFEECNGVQVAMIKAQDVLKNRSVLWVETRLPWLFYPLRSFAIRQITKRANV